MLQSNVIAFSEDTLTLRWRKNELLHITTDHLKKIEDRSVKLWKFRSKIMFFKKLRAVQYCFTVNFHLKSIDIVNWNGEQVKIEYHKKTLEVFLDRWCAGENMQYHSQNILSHVYEAHEVFVSCDYWCHRKIQPILILTFDFTPPIFEAMSRFYEWHFLCFYHLIKY